MIDDVVIVGGGPVGAALGTALRRAGRWRVVLIEREVPAGSASDRDGRVVALSRSSEQLLVEAGIWSRLTGEALAPHPYERMHVWPERGEARGSGSLTFDAAELAEPNLGHIVGYDALQRAGLAAFVEAGGELQTETLIDLTFEADDVCVRTATAEHRARLVVGADGARSRVREAAGLGLEREDYGQLGLVARVRGSRSHENTAWQRFLGEGTLALLPLADGSSSIVWSVPRERAEVMLRLDAEAFSQALTVASDGVLGTLVLEGTRSVFPLRRAAAPHYVRERCALLGDAAHVVHPLAGQGVNLGFGDAAALLENLLEARRTREDLGALRILRRYERARKGENESMGLAMDLLNRFVAFGRDTPGEWAQRGLGFVGRSALLRRLFASRALGISSGGRSSPHK